MVWGSKERENAATVPWNVFGEQTFQSVQSSEPGNQILSSKLARYRAKRNFKKTREPRGAGRIAPSPHPRFVIHKHDATRLHYDLRLEVGGVFKSWAVARGVSLDPHDKRLAVEVEDHPLEYGDFEGVIPKGEYGGGTVMLWDWGFWQSETGEDPLKSLERGELKFVLVGEKLKGSWVLVRLKHDTRGGKRNNWLLIKHREEGVKTALPKREEDRSVASGRSMMEIAEGKGEAPSPFIVSGMHQSAGQVWHSKKSNANPTTIRKERPREVKRASFAFPDFIPPQLCRSADKPPSGPGWGHEIKLDGYRMQLRVEHRTAKLISRSALDWTSRFAPIAEAAANLPDAILDGEIISLKGGNHDFSELQAALSSSSHQDLVYIAFDLLVVEGEDLRRLPLRERQQHLQSVLTQLPARARDRIRSIGHLEGSGAQVLEAACRIGLEGVVSKKLDEPYLSGRSDSWIKSKCRPGQEVVIGGWSGTRRNLRSLLVGVHRDGELVYAGRVGTGFNQRNSGTLLKKLASIATGKAPFSKTSAPRGSSDLNWVEPALVAEIEFVGFTRDGMVRQAAFKGLREDKPASDVVGEQGALAETNQAEPKGAVDVRRTVTTANGSATVLGVQISHADKELWPASNGRPAVSKIDLAQYYERAGPLLLPHIKGRPCSFVRAPDGIEAENFFQRHTMPGMSKLVTPVVVAGDRKPYLQIDSVEALVAMAQVAAVEVHPWNSAPGDSNAAGRLVFDLDPGPGVPMSMLITAAKELRERLAGLGLEAFCKTSGGKGLHVVTPLATSRGRAIEWRQAKPFAQAICAQMASDSPERYLVKMTKKLREGRIFLDYLRNDRMSTAVAVLSPRARAGATVSMPLAWSQVKTGLDPQRFTIRNAVELLTPRDPWRDYAEAAKPLSPAIKRLLR